MTELKPCPFCNGRAELKHYTIEGYEPDRMYYVECSKCGQTVVHGKFGTTYHSDKWAINKAITVWNKRPNLWHTGTPTEEGWYLLHTKETIPYRVAYMRNNRLSTSDSYIRTDIVIAWQKIEPYKED